MSSGKLNTFSRSKHEGKEYKEVPVDFIVWFYYNFPAWDKNLHNYMKKNHVEVYKEVQNQKSDKLLGCNIDADEVNGLPERF